MTAEAEEKLSIRHVLVKMKRSKGFDRFGIYEYNKAYMYTS